jgi:hypothetical protein
MAERCCGTTGAALGWTGAAAGAPNVIRGTAIDPRGMKPEKSCGGAERFECNGDGFDEPPATPTDCGATLAVTGSVEELGEVVVACDATGGCGAATTGLLGTGFFAAALLAAAVDIGSFAGGAIGNATSAAGVVSTGGVRRASITTTNTLKRAAPTTPPTTLTSRDVFRISRS